MKVFTICLSLLIPGFILCMAPTSSARNATDPSRYQYIYIERVRDKENQFFRELILRELSKKGYTVTDRINKDKESDTLIAKCIIEDKDILPNNIFFLPFNIAFGIIKSLVNHNKISCIVSRASDNAPLFKNEIETADSYDNKIHKVFLNLPEKKGPEIIAICITGECDDSSISIKEKYKVAVADAKYKAAQQAGIQISANQTLSTGISSRDKFYRNYLREIEEKSQTILLPGYTIEDHGLAQNGVYKVVLKGKIVID